MKRIKMSPRSLVVCMSGLLMMLFLSASAVVAVPSTPRVVASTATQVEFGQRFVLHLHGHADLQLIHRALAKLQAKGQVGTILSSSAVSLHVEATAEAVAELEGISGVAKVTSQSLAHPFSSLSNRSSRASSQLVERWLLLEREPESVLDLLPQLFSTLARWQAEGTVSEFERVELNLIRVVMASDAVTQLDTLNGVLEISDSPFTTFTQAAQPAQLGRAPSGQRAAGSEATTQVRPYWLVLKPTGSRDAPSAVLLRELARLQASGTVQQVEQTLKDNRIKVMAVVGAEDLLHKLPTVLDVAIVAPATARHQAQERALSSARLTPYPTPTAVDGGSPIPTPTAVEGGPPTPTPPYPTPTVVGGGPLPTPAPPYPTPTPPPGGGGVGNSSMAGTVTAPDGTPLEGVQVAAFLYYEQWDYWGWTNSVLTDGNGQYTISDLPSGSYRVGFFKWDGNYLEEFYNDALDLERATDVLLAEAETVSGIDAQLSQGAHITGIVTDENGNPLPNVSVEAYQYNDTYDYWEFVSLTQSDANGQYDVARLRTGIARVGFIDQEGGHLPEFYDNAPDLGSASDISVTFEETTSGIDAQLADGAHIMGTITDQNGNPLPEVLVEVFQYNQDYGYWDWANFALTDLNGEYDVGGLTTGTYRIGFIDQEGAHMPEFYEDAPDVEHATDISITLGETIRGIDAQLAEGGRITGTITDENGNPLPEVSVEVYQYDEIYNYWYPINHALTDASGQYDVGGLSSGTYRVGFYDWMGGNLPEFYNDAPNVEQASDIAVTFGETTAGIDAQLTEGGHITGTVTDQNGNPLSEVSVDVFQLNEMFAEWVPINHANTDANGQYDVRGVGTGTYRVAFFDWQNRYLLEFYDDAPNLENATDVAVTTGETTSGIDAQLNDGEHITGTVTDENGNRLPGVGVEVYRYNNQFDYWESVNYSYTDSNGQYDVAGLSSGTYRVNFIDWAGGHLSEYYNNAPDLESATDIVVTEGQTGQNIDASLSEGGHITGVVTDPDGNPLSNVRVEVLRYQDAYDYWEWVNYGNTDSNGQYDIRGLRSGRYRVGFFDGQARYLPEFYNNAPNVESATDVLVTAGETTSDINVSLNDGGHITGIVTDANGNRLPDITVEVYQYNSQYNYWESIHYTLTDSSGHYDLPALRSGTYRVGFLDWQGRYLPEYYDNAANVESASDLSVTEAQTTAGINASLSEGGHIIGRISNQEGNPLANIAVELYQYNQTVDHWVSINYGQTDASGGYDIGGLKSGIYRVGFFDWEFRYVSEYYNNAVNLEEATDIVVTESETTAGIDAQLEEGGHITGRVTAPDGSALRDVSIEVYRLDSNGEWVRTGYGYSNFDGRYDVGGLNTGAYRLAFMEWGRGYLSEYYNDAVDIESATDISVTVGQTTEGIDAQLAEGGHITGLVTSAEGTPLPYISIEVYRHNENGEFEWAGSAYSNVDGRYDVVGLHTDTYQVGFFDWEGPYANEYYDDGGDLDNATDVAVTVGQTTEEINASLDIGGTITGHITAPDGSPATSVPVEVYRRNSNGEWESADGWGYSDFNGQYEVHGLASGTYRVAFHPRYGNYFTKYYSDARDLESATDVSVTRGETTSGIDVQLSEGGHITGTVTGEPSSTRFVAGGANPLAGIQIEAYRQNGSGEWEWAGWATTNPSGQYDLGGLASGSYRVGFFESAGLYAYEYYDNATDLEHATDITVIAGESTTNIDAALGDAAEAVANASSPSGSVVVDPQTGEITIVQQNGNQSDITISKVVTCLDGQAVSEVTLIVGENSYPMTASESNNNKNEYATTIPAAQVVDGVEIKVSKLCNDNSDEEMIGHIELFDPSGYITDATTGDPIANASVTLYNVPGWQARTGAGQSATPNTCQSNLSKGANQPWSQRAPTDLGVMAATNSGQIDPATNPLVTDAEGYYGWDVAAGCWYVIVEATGYQTLVSPVVGVPPEVTDLNLALTPSNTPMVQFSATTYQVNENEESATIAITLLRPLTETVTLEYNTSNQTATAGEDYMASNGRISIPAGETVKTFSVTIRDDDTTEANETIMLTLSNPDKARLGTRHQATLTIVDDDGTVLDHKIYLPLLTNP